MKRTSLAVAMLVALGVSLAAKAQDGPAPKLAWQIGPTTGAIGDKATIAVPAGYGFLGAADTKKFLELNHNLASGREPLLFGRCKRRHTKAIYRSRRHPNLHGLRTVVSASNFTR